MELKRPNTVVRYLHAVEDGVLVTVVIAIIFLAFLQIVLRNFMGLGFTWISPLLGVLVLWVAMLGALVATRQKDHIKINVIQPFLPEKYQVYIHVINHLFSAAVLGLVGYYAIEFVKLEMESSTTAFADVPVWIVELILPVTFVVMAFRFLILAVVDIHTLIQRGGRK